jgi:hypothetical protein
MASAPSKFVLDDFIARAVSGTPQELHPFFDKFRDLYTKKCAIAQTLHSIRTELLTSGYGTN